MGSCKSQRASEPDDRPTKRDSQGSLLQKALFAKLAGADYYNFFALCMLATAIVFIPVAMAYKEKRYLQDEGGGADDDEDDGPPDPPKKISSLDTVTILDEG